eukprot:7378066-Prymnesium_polylepis.1
MAAALTNKEIGALLQKVDQPMDPRLVAALDEREGQFSAMLKERGVGAALVEDSATLRRFL